MRKIPKIAFCLALLMLIACTQNVETKTEISEESTFEVYSIHELEIKPDVDSKEFESFVLKEIAPIYNNMKGQRFILVKGDRGLRVNKYAILLTFESIEDRNRIYPPSGEFVGDFGSDTLWNKFDSMLITGIGSRHTDYIRIDH
jgi:hypothetical protein